MITRKRTSETANENFITDHGSIRFRASLARRGPREAAEVTLERAARTASVTRAAPSWPAAATDFSVVDLPLVVVVPTGEPTRPAETTSSSDSGGVMPGGRLYVVVLDSAFTTGGASLSVEVPLGLADVVFSAGTVARPTAARPVAVAPSMVPSTSTGFVGTPAAPDIACVSVIH
jgi:hypothetical protein